MKKRGFKIFASCLMALTFSFGACAQEKDVELFRTLNGTNIPLYGAVDLYISERCEEQDVVFSSSDESVISIKNGQLIANSAGQAEITATWNGITQKQIYTVTADSSSWELSVREMLTLTQSQTFALTPELKLAGSIVEEASFTYTATNTSIATVAQDGTVTAKAKGTTDLVVDAFVNEEKVASQNVICSVVDNVGIYPSKGEYTLYLLDEIRGQSFEKTIPLQATVYNGGEMIENATVEWKVADETIATLDSENVLSAVKAGTTYLVGKCTVSGKEYKTQQIPVSVEIPLIDLKDDVIVDLSKTSQILDSFALFGEGYSVGSVYNVAKDKSIAVTDGKIRTNSFKAGEHSCIVYNTEKTVGAIVNLVAADFVVYTLEDLKEMNTAEHASHYIALANDIEVNGAYRTSRPTNGVEFMGTLNGLGHAIIGMKLTVWDGYGLFNGLIGATVKNLCFLDAEISNTNCSLIAYANSYQECLIDNIYAEITFSGGASMNFASGLVSFGHVGQITVTNTLLRVSGLEESPRREGNGLVVGRLYWCRLMMQNCYIIGQGSLCGQTANVYNVNYATVNKDVSSIYSDGEQFERERAKENSKIDLSGFNHYWDMDGDELRFKRNN